MMKDPVGKSSEANGSSRSISNTRAQALSYFIVTVLGFSFWFFMAVPFASHRESYEWLGEVYSQDFSQAFSFISKTYRPLAQASTWLGFLILDPRVFPTSILRQTLLQGFIYAMFVVGWWLIYVTATQRRLFALVAFVAGGVFFSGYVQLFHIYGIFYVPVMLTLGTLLRFHASRTLYDREVWFAGVALLLALWHPFATALFIGFYFGFYLDTFYQRSRAQHIRAVVILIAGIVAIAALAISARQTEILPLESRLFGFVVSYKTNEVNQVASVVAFLLTQMVVLSMGLAPRLKLAASCFVSALSVVCFLKSFPLLLLWLCAVMIKLFRMRCWSLFFLTLTAVLLPFLGAIGTPVYALFAIVVAVYVTPLGWSHAEKRMAFLETKYVVVAPIALAAILLMVRMGIQVPIVTRAASPLLAERERTYQLEKVLDWIHSSKYCGYEIAFVEDGSNPVDSVESAITRRNRPPAGLKEVRIFWDAVLRCQKAGRSNDEGGTATVTFGGPRLADSRPVFKVEGRYAGDAVVWIGDSQ